VLERYTLTEWPEIAKTAIRPSPLPSPPKGCLGSPPEDPERKGEAQEMEPYQIVPNRKKYF
jgi:hypothetical protein